MFLKIKKILAVGLACAMTATLSSISTANATAGGQSETQVRVSNTTVLNTYNIDGIEYDVCKNNDNNTKYTICKVEGSKIKSANIPAEVKGIPVTYINIGLDCTNLEEINVDPNNKYYSSQDGVLFRMYGGEKAVDCYPQAAKRKSYVIPSFVTYTAPNSFYKCNSLEKLYIPKSVTNIPIAVYEIIYKDPNGENAEPASEQCAFFYCSNLKNVYYEGDEKTGVLLKRKFEDEDMMYTYSVFDGFDPIIHYNTPMPQSAETTTTTTNLTTTTTSSQIQAPTQIYNIKIILKQSDPNNDNVIDSSDATCILIDYANALLNGENARTLTNKQADSNGDGIVDSSDATNILIYYANKLLEN